MDEVEKRRPAPGDAEQAGTIPVEIAWAAPDEQVILGMEVAHGTTIEQAVQRSGILERFAEIDWPHVDVGVFGKLARKEQVLAPRDRVEIYRPLLADPKEVRRTRAARRASQEDQDAADRKAATQGLRSRS